MYRRWNPDKTSKSMAEMYKKKVWRVEYFCKAMCLGISLRKLFSQIYLTDKTQECIY